jgi:hypothetical protein
MAKVNISKLARAAGLTPTVVHGRLSQGWTLDDALRTPKYGRRSKSAPVTPTTETKVTEQPVPQKSSPSWMPIVAVAVLALLAVLSFYA